MKGLDSSNTDHELILIPRFYPVGDITLQLLNEQTDEVFEYILTPLIMDGYIYISFTQAFDNNSNFRIKILSNSEIIYRGKLFVTNQAEDLQEYKITKDTFTL